MTSNGATTNCGARQPEHSACHQSAPVAGHLSMLTEISNRHGKRYTGNNANGKWHRAYHARFVVETARYRVKQQFGKHLTRWEYAAEVGEAMAVHRALNKMMRAGMPESVRIV